MLKIIKGDSKDIAVTLKNATGDAVYQVYFSSSSLKDNETVSILGTLDETKGTYDFSLVRTDTENYKAGSFTYDITVLLGTSTTYKVVTVIHNAAGIVEEKTNAYTKKD